MPVYNWEGRTRQGAMKKGVMEAANEAAVMAQLRAQMHHADQRSRSKPKDLSRAVSRSCSPRISDSELVIFTRQFATMIDAGLPLVQCLDILGEQQENKTFKEVIRDVQVGRRAGLDLRGCPREAPEAFDELYVNLVAAGEVGGILDTILNRLAVYLEKADSLKRKVKGAMVYPSTILVVAIGVVVLMLVKVIPVFEKMFADFGGTLAGADPGGREHEPLHAGVHRADHDGLPGCGGVLVPAGAAA